jgi:DnaJ-class molecular chaperone
MLMSDDAECLTCNGKGGKLEYDSDGDGVWATVVVRLDPCPDCIGSGKCPGCGAPMTVEQQAAAERDIETFTCSIDACSWHYDADRFDTDTFYADDDWHNADYYETYDDD